MRLAYLLTDDCFFDLGKVVQGLQEAGSIGAAADQLDESAELLRDDEQHLVLILGKF
jgi:hypothetical protein